MTPLDPTRKRLLFRATHRGTKEADAIVGGFFTANIGTLADARIAEAEEFLDVLDLDLLDWLMERQPVPERWQGTIFDDIRAFYLSMCSRK